MLVDRTRCYYVLNCLLLCATLTGRRKTIPHLCVSERNRPMPVRRWLNLTHEGLGKLNPGGIGLTSLINVWNGEVFSCHSMLHLYCAHRAILVLDWAELFSSSNAAGTNGCLDLSCCYFHQVETEAFHVGDVLVPGGDELKTVRLAFWRQSSVGWTPAN